MLSLTLTAIKTAVSNLAEVTLSAAGAYPEAMVEGWINSSINQYEIERARVAGGYREKTATLSTVSTTTPAVQTFPANEIVSLTSLSPAAQAVKSVWINTGGVRTQLEPLAESDRGRPWLSIPANSGRPSVYETIELEDGTLALHLWPPADSVYTLEVNYFPQPVQLATGSDAWRYEAGTEDAVLCDIALRLLERADQADTRQYQALAARRDSAFRTLRRALGQRRRGVMQMRDTRLEQYAAQRWWPR